MWAVTKALNQPNYSNKILFMFKHWHQWLLIFPLILTIDIVGVFLAHWLAFILRMHYLPSSSAVPPDHVYFNLSVFLALFSPMFFSLLRLYGSNVSFSLFNEWIRVFLAVTSISVFEITSIFFLRDFLPYHNFTFSRLTAILSWLLGVVLIIFGRSLVRLFQRNLRQKLWGVKRALVLERNALAESLLAQREYYLKQGYVLLDMIDLDATSLKSLVDQYRADTLIYTGAPLEGQAFFDLTALCQHLNLTLFIWPNINQMATSKIQLTEIAGTPFITVQNPPLRFIHNRLKKRIFDVLFSFIALIALSPVMLLIAALIKLTSSGSILYKQERVSRDGYVFWMYKFRTMPINSEQSSGPVWAKSGDKRSTPIGSFLRRSSLDELPQILNVLRGDMSIVGPRPERPFFVEQFKDEILNYPERHLVKAGITGWAQINGWRGDTSLDERIKCDLYYIKNWTLLFDIRIIMRSFYIVIRDYLQKKAY